VTTDTAEVKAVPQETQAKRSPKHGKFILSVITVVILYTFIFDMPWLTYSSIMLTIIAVTLALWRMDG
jgi:hypothetical protein